MLLIESADYAQMPWKNGKGTTTQIAIFPPNATTDNFAWRISMAVVQDDGPFSSFPEIDRTLVVLQGAGIILKVAGSAKQRLDRKAEPYSFAADAATQAQLIDGPILDLNVMSRRDRFSHRVEKLGGATRIFTAATLVLFAHGTALQIDNGSESSRVKRGDSAIFEDGAKELDIVPDGPGDYYLVEFVKI